jgi:hypothetical protein
MRVLKSLAAFVTFFVVVAFALGVCGLYLAATGRSLPILRTLLGRLGTVIEGQRTEQLELDVHVRPTDRHLAATARLAVRAERAGRQRLYFLLGGGLHVRRVWAEAADGTPTPLPHYRLWLLTAVELPAPLGAGEATRIGIEYAGNPTAGGLGGGSAVFDADEVILQTGHFWFPADLHSFVTADVSVTLPAALTLAHNGREVERTRRGDAATIRWTTPRPVPGLALVAGRYAVSTRSAEDRVYRALRPADIQLDPERLLSAAAASEAFFAARLGPSQFPATTLVVTRAVRRAFHDGTGLIVIPPPYFTRGDYGFLTIAHEVAHHWWGATVAERWLHPGTGGEFIVEGFAEGFAWLAVEAELGEGALLAVLERSLYDPAHARSLAELSVLDNEFDPRARPSIYQKGAFAVRMLHRQMGAERFFSTARAFIEQFRYRQATDRDLEAVVAAAGSKDLKAFFAAWVRGNDAFELSLDPRDGGADVRNHGTAPPPEPLELWRLGPSGDGTIESVALGSRVTLGGAARLVIDPHLVAADMYRHNNVLPRRANPRAVAANARGQVFAVFGEPYPWAPATVEHLDAGGRTVHAWAFDGGLEREPVWSADGTRVVAVEAEREGRVTAVALHPSDGSRQGLGRDAAVTAAADATFVARGDRLLRLAGGHTDLVVQHAGRTCAEPVASPDGTRIAYAVRDTREMELRVVGADGSHDRLLLAAPAAEVAWRWAVDGTRLFAVLPGDWDWQVWELPLNGAPRALIREAAAIPDLAVAPDGRIAVVAAPAIDPARVQHEVFVLDPAAGAVRRFDLGGHSAHRVAWLDADTLLVVTSDPAALVVPRHRELRRLRLSDGGLGAFP